MPSVMPPDQRARASGFLSELVACWTKRRRAISRKLAQLKFEKLIEREGGSEQAKIEIDCIVTRSPTTSVRLFVWQDRWCWVDARSRIKLQPWTWQFTYQGLLVGGIAARELVVALEESLFAASPVQSDHAGHLLEIWQPILARGPRPAD